MLCLAESRVICAPNAKHGIVPYVLLVSYQEKHITLSVIDHLHKFPPFYICYYVEGLVIKIITDRKNYNFNRVAWIFVADFFDKK